MVNAPSTPGVYEFVQSSGTWIALSPKEVASDGVTLNPLTVLLDQIAPGAPTAVTNLRLVSKTATTINVAWDEVADTTVGGHHIQLGGVQWNGDLAAAATTATITGLTASTTYSITATRFNSTKQESPVSNVLSVTTKPPVVGVPTAPSTFSRTALTSSGATFAWTETTDATVTKHQLYLDGVSYGSALGATTLSGSYTGLAASSTHTAYVTRSNSSGESDPSPSASFTTSKGGGVNHDVAMGITNANDSGLVSSSPAVRVYNTGAATSAVSTFGARIVAVTDDSSWGLTGGATTATAVDNFLTSFYGWTDAGGVSKHAGVEVRIANGNETDKHYTSGSLPQNFIDTHKAMYNVVHSTDSAGNRKYPKASMWIDMTQFHITTKDTGTRYKAIAPWLDGMACSMYPPGRMKTPTVFSPYSYCDPVLNTMIDWNGTYPNCKMFATWEIGIPIDHPTDWSGSAAGGEPTASTDFTIRPRYLTGGVDSASTNWKGFLQYVYDVLNGAGIEMHEQCYFDRQAGSSGSWGPPNQFGHDHGSGRANPDSETAWMAWTPGKRLANG